MTAAGPPAAIAAVAGEWDDLATRLGAAPFLRPGWFAAWWEAFGRGDLEVIQLRTEGRLAGVLPVVRRFGAIHSPTNWHTTLFGPVMEQERAPELAGLLFEDRPRHISLSFLDPLDAGTAAVRAAADEAGYRELTRVRLRSPFISTTPGWDAYWAGRGRKLRAAIRQRLKNASKMGTLEFEVVDGTGPWEKALAEGLRIEASGWKGSRGTAVESRPETRRFYSGVAGWAARLGILRLGFLRMDGRAIAFNLYLEDDASVSTLKGGFDPAFASLGPGVMIYYEMIKRAFERGLRTFEFLGAAEEWKLRWTDTTHDRILVQTFAPTLAGRLTEAAFVHGRPMAKRTRDLLRRVRPAATAASPASTGPAHAGEPGPPREGGG